MSTLSHHHPATTMAPSGASYDGKSAETRHLKPNELSSGTTIIAIPFDGGVVLGADSRVSTGTYVANRTSDKIAQLHDRIWCCRSGSAADTQALTDYVKHYLGQLAVETGRVPTVKVAAHLMRRLCYENKDNLMAGVIVGGWDPVDGGSVCKLLD
jgi:20S proteasome subunit beta 1